MHVITKKDIYREDPKILKLVIFFQVKKPRPTKLQSISCVNRNIEGKNSGSAYKGATVLGM